MEHAVYLCSWSQSSEGYTVWVKARPPLRAEAPTYAEAEERLIEAIHKAGGAMQAVLEFDPPLPASELEAKYTDPEIYLIGADDRFQTDTAARQPFESAEQVDERLKEVDSFYLSPVCRACRWTNGGRSDRPLSLKYAPMVLTAHSDTLAVKPAL